jgi:1,4-dihydroxy-2-naphthoate octaprenyltransferase
MLWYTGSLILLIWAVLTFVLHKHGAVHILLFLALSFYLIQLAQDRRTREYKRSLEQ